jgi:hypothetical protein
MEVQEVTWDRGGTERAGIRVFDCGKGNKNHELWTWMFIHNGIMSAAKMVEFF